MANERSQLLTETLTPSAAYAAARRRLGGPQSMTFGALPSGDLLKVRRELGLMSALILGATGAGKSRLLIALLLEPLKQLIDDLRLEPTRHADVGVELELIDPKFETFDLFRKYVAALWLDANDAGRALLERSVRVIDWSHDQVTPLTPFDNHFPEISNAYLAHLRADVSARTSPQTYTDAMRQLLYMFDWLLIELRYPLSYRFAVRFMHDAAFRKGVLTQVAEPEVRYYFDNFDLTVPRQTRDGFLRRVQYGTSFPELRASYIPPEAIDKLGLTKEAPITLVNTACTTTLPQALGYERATWRATDVLCAAPRRDPRRPKSFVLEEAVRFLEDANADHVETLLTGLRTLRSANMGIVLTAQDFSNAVPASVVRTVLLNTTWIAGFRAREDAQLFWPHVVGVPDDQRTESAKREAYLKEMAGLARQRYLLLVKGNPALPLRAPDVPKPSDAHDVSEDELLDVFNRKIAAKSMLRTATAMELIAEWEARVVEQGESRPSTKNAPRKPSITSLADLKRFFTATEEE
ncbi:MAG TPA: hypothetical protein VGQ76_03310 [Thermoanaerobaculia bacterium]|nr:hypothetical protein [Thermoanaerobaculia bacterium]